MKTSAFKDVFDSSEAVKKGNKQMNKKIKMVTMAACAVMMLGLAGCGRNSDPANAAIAKVKEVVVSEGQNSRTLDDRYDELSAKVVKTMNQAKTINPDFEVPNKEKLEEELKRFHGLSDEKKLEALKEIEKMAAKSPEEFLAMKRLL